MFVDLIYNEVTQEYEASYPSTGAPVTFSTSLGGSLFGDGTSGAPSIAFTAESTLGFYRLSAAVMGLSGSLTTSGSISTASVTLQAAQFLLWTGRAVLASPANGVMNLSIGAVTIGSQFKADALPTISSGFGTSPAVTAGSTPLAGSIDVGTGGVATTGVILWNGTAFAAAPFIAVTCSLGAVPTIAVTTTTQVTFTTSVAWPASTKVSWICISARA